MKYGVTTDYVLGLDVVLADGTLVSLGGKRIKDVAGLSLLKLFVGSEGTLGIVTRAILRLVPAQAAAVDPGGDVPGRRRRRPGGRRGRPDAAPLDAGADGPAPRSTRSRTSGRWAWTATPARCWSPSPTPRRPPASEEVEVMRDGLRGGRAPPRCSSPTTPRRASMFVEARRAAFPAIEARGALLLEDVGAPIPLLPELLAAIAAIADEHDVEIPVVAHAGDGNTHPIIVFDAARPGVGAARARRRSTRSCTPRSRSAARSPASTASAAPRRRALPDQLGPDVMALTRRVKDALDPDGILNPGAIL